MATEENVDKSYTEKEISPTDSNITAVTYFAVENLPNIFSLKKMMKKNGMFALTIGKNKWSLQVSEDIGRISSGKMGNIKRIIFTKENDPENKHKCGIFTEENFDVVLGAILKELPIYYKDPIKLAYLRKELKKDNKKRISDFPLRSSNAQEIATALNLTTGYVSRLVYAPKKTAGGKV